MEIISVIDGAHLVALPNGRSLMVGAPPEALKVLLLWEWPTPQAVLVPPDPLYAHGINQASFEFLIYHHLFQGGGIQNRQPFHIICDADQRARLETLVRNILQGPTEAEMERWGTPAIHRRQLRLETEWVSGEMGRRPLADLVRVLSFADGKVRLPGEVVVRQREVGICEVGVGGRWVPVPRVAARRGTLPFLFAGPDATGMRGARLGIQVIGSASGFSGAEWSSCFIVWINGLPLIVDGTPYLDEQLERLGIEEEQILGYLITHNHEDHANVVGQLISRRRVTVITAPPVMAGLATRLSAITGRPESEVKRMVNWVPLYPELDRFGVPLHWYGAEIHAWYSVHTIPTVGIQVGLNGRRIRLPGDTLWGSQLDPLLACGVLTQARYEFIQHSYQDADLVVADAGGGPIHPEPREIQERLAQCTHRILTTHIAPAARALLPNAEPGAAEVLCECRPVDPDDLLAMGCSPLLRDVPERWLPALYQAGEVITPELGQLVGERGAKVVLRGRLILRNGTQEQYSLCRGDLFYAPLARTVRWPALHATAEWNRVLVVPEETFAQMLAEIPSLAGQLERLFRARTLWQQVIGVDLPLETLVALTRLGRYRRFGAGVTVLRQGEPAKSFYVVTEGEVEVLREDGGGERHIGIFGPGYAFGEIALLGAGRRTATVRALTETEVLELPARAFRRYLMEIPLARYQIGRTGEARRVALDRGRRKG
ncbi:MAG: cyclic nucleotide-binding domain-containing protein [Armatimonadetes bacterium]|nr:cyclic nucleotide-binding domain-containing protein [Armatimonadota bacterium]